jgi:hypothetical protein
MALVIPNRKAVRNLLSAVTTTTHVGTAASALPKRVKRALYPVSFWVAQRFQRCDWSFIDNEALAFEALNLVWSLRHYFPASRGQPRLLSSSTLPNEQFLQTRIRINRRRMILHQPARIRSRPVIAV